MKIGTIDIGTNSMRLLTADYQDGKIINRKNLLKKQILNSYNICFLSLKSNYKTTKLPCIHLIQRIVEYYLFLLFIDA